jgi:hypothetical protein
MAVVVSGSKKIKLMKSHWRKLLSLLPTSLEKKFYNNFFLEEHREWERKGRPLPVSNLSKQNLLREFQKKYHVKTLVETGTYLGDTLYSLATDFERLYSVELSEHYHKLAKRRFKNFPHVSLLQGDSGVVLKDLVPKLDAPAIFWLDGHYSGGLTAKGEQECPVFEELKSIFSSPFQHFIFIDDARLFIGKNDYPTISELRAFVRIGKPDYNFIVENDCIRLLPIATKISTISSFQ